MNNPLDKIKWLEKGFIIQKSKQEYILGQGPFSYSMNPQPQSLYHPHFFLDNKKPWIKSSLIWKANKKECLSFLFGTQEGNLLKRKEKNDHPESLFKNSIKPSFLQYQDIFYQAQQAFSKGIFEKVVPVFYERFFSKPNLLLLIRNLFKNTYKISHGFLYGFWNKKNGILGLTPELLFSIERDQFFTMALAGTGWEPGPSLLKNPKELKEHDFVVKSIEESLEDLIKWSEKSISEFLFPPLKHLKTCFKGQLIKKVHFEKLCKTIHPTSALGGYPRRPAVSWLKDQKSQKKRDEFGAPFGFFENKEKAFCLVALRSLVWDVSEIKIYSGAGLIKESLLQKEWQELFLKRKQIKMFFEN